MKIMIKNAYSGYDNMGDISSIDANRFPFLNGNAHKWIIVARFQNNRISILYVGKHNGEKDEIDQWFEWFKKAFKEASDQNQTCFLECPYESSKIDYKEAIVLLEMLYGSKHFVSATRYNEQPYDRQPISHHIQPDYGMN